MRTQVMSFAQLQEEAAHVLLPPASELGLALALRIQIVNDRCLLSA